MAEMLLINPRRRKRRTTTHRRRRRNPTRAKRRRSPIRRRARRHVARRRRRNPIASRRSLQKTVSHAGLGAVGALGLDVALGYIPLPDNLKAGYVGYAVKGLLAIALGMVAEKSRMVTRTNAETLTNGAMTVVLHDLLRNSVQTFAPQIQLGEYLNAPIMVPNGLGYAGSGWNPQSYKITDDSMRVTQDAGLSGFGEYLNDDGMPAYGY